ncbi:VOC family protein [Thalassoglobus sp. JC818]|uniref:VOC family protein n=1 Tax=Thalassoglobus sp. JC818 TaxID=3232136 RepID=UPI00345A2F1B
MTSNTRQIENTIPVIPVSNLTQSIAFYTQKLGFHLEWGGEDGSKICLVNRDGCSLMLAEAFGPSPPQWVWIGVESEELFEEWKNAGAKVRQEPKNWSWAYAMKFEDIDGNILWIGTEPRTNEPYADRIT